MSSTVRIYPFPRFHEKHVKWGQWQIQIDGDAVESTDVPDRWDPNSEILISISVDIVELQKSRLQTSTSLPSLWAAVACRETGRTFSQTVPLRFKANRAARLTAEALLKVDASRIESNLDLSAMLTAPVSRPDLGSPTWLQRRIVAEGPISRINLDREIREFPTSAISFEAEGWFDAPWRIDLMASHLSDNFSTAIRLHFNEDYKNVVELIKGRNRGNTREALHAAILRVLLHTAFALSRNLTDSETPDEIASDFPESIGAAAHRAATDHLKLRSLYEALVLIRDNPEELDYRIAASTGEGKR